MPAGEGREDTSPDRSSVRPLSVAVEERQRWIKSDRAASRGMCNTLGPVAMRAGKPETGMSSRKLLIRDGKSTSGA